MSPSTHPPLTPEKRAEIEALLNHRPATTNSTGDIVATLLSDAGYTTIIEFAYDQTTVRRLFFSARPDDPASVRTAVSELPSAHAHFDYPVDVAVHGREVMFSPARGRAYILSPGQASHDVSPVERPLTIACSGLSTLGSCGAGADV